MARPQFAGISHVALQLSDLEEGMQFFNTLLGFKVKFETQFDGFRIVMLKAGKVEIEMWENKDERNTESQGFEVATGSVHHIAVGVKKLDEVMAYVKAHNIPIVADVYEPTRGIREAIVQGPDHVKVQFVEQNVPLLIWRAVTGDFN